MQSEQTTPPKRTTTKEVVQKLLDRMTFECVNCEMDYALAEYIGKVLIAESARADQAEAATAAVVARCADKAHECWADGVPPPEYEEHIRALAPASGLAMLAELRAESEARHQLHLEQVRITKEWIAERDTLAAANAALEARVARLETLPPDYGHDGLRWKIGTAMRRSIDAAHPETDRDAALYHAFRAGVRAALASASAVSEAGGATSAATTPQPGEVPASSAPAPALASGKPGEAGNG